MSAITVPDYYQGVDLNKIEPLTPEQKAKGLSHIRRIKAMLANVGSKQAPNTENMMRLARVVAS